MRTLKAMLVAVSLTLPAAAATIDVKVTASTGSSVENAVVYALPQTPVAPGGRKVATMDQKDRVFVPYVLAVQKGTWVEFPNSDNIRHQVYSNSPARRFQLPLYVGKPAFPVQFPTAGVVELGCNIHEEMRAFIIVVDTPYFATTSAGAAAINELPAGNYTVHVWYPGMRKEPAPVSVMVGASDRPAVAFIAAK